MALVVAALSVTALAVAVLPGAPALTALALVRALAAVVTALAALALGGVADEVVARGQHELAVLGEPGGAAREVLQSATAVGVQSAAGAQVAACGERSVPAAAARGGGGAGGSARTRTAVRRTGVLGAVARSRVRAA
ncbi:hypothetical protein GTY20_04965, partial [Streptomyces sp. SID4946]|nr:hypothetical protein [Streptomyces sp. SID4946]